MARSKTVMELECRHCGKCHIYRPSKKAMALFCCSTHRGVTLLVARIQEPSRGLYTIVTKAVKATRFRDESKTGISPMAVE
jgi:hypothetical protein